MLYRVLADGVVLVHAAFVTFVVLGGFLAWRWRAIALLHVPCALWGIAIEYGGWICPLTPLENLLRERAGLEGYRGGFVEHYVSRRSTRRAHPPDASRAGYRRAGAEPGRLRHAAANGNDPRDVPGRQPRCASAYYASTHRRPNARPLADHGPRTPRPLVPAANPPSPPPLATQLTERQRDSISRSRGSPVRAAWESDAGWRTPRAPGFGPRTASPREASPLRITLLAVLAACGRPIRAASSEMHLRTRFSQGYVGHWVVARGDTVTLAPAGRPLQAHRRDPRYRAGGRRRHVSFPGSAGVRRAPCRNARRHVVRLAGAGPDLRLAGGPSDRSPASACRRWGTHRGRNPFDSQLGVQVPISLNTPMPANGPRSAGQP